MGADRAPYSGGQVGVALGGGVVQGQVAEGVEGGVGEQVLDEAVTDGRGLVGSPSGVWGPSNPVAVGREGGQAEVMARFTTRAMLTRGPKVTRAFPTGECLPVRWRATASRAAPRRIAASVMVPRTRVAAAAGVWVAPGGVGGGASYHLSL